MGAREADSSDALRSELVALMRSHSRELEDTLVARIRNADPSLDFDDEDIVWLRPAAIEVVNAVATGFEEGDRWTSALPPPIVAQIQYAVRREVSLESMLRAFSIVANVFFEFFGERLDDLSLDQDALRYAVKWQSWNGDRLMNAFAVEYNKEVERLSRSPSRYLAERVQGLLAGGSGDYADLGYRLDTRHIGLIAVGAKADLTCRRLAERLGCDLLLLPHAENTVWAWLGSRRQIGFPELEQLVATESGPLSFAAGEPRDGIEGWRLTHREAQAALAVALLEEARLTRYSDVALVADALRNEATGKSLIDRYLGPLDQYRDGGSMRKTLRIYLDLDCNAASTASALDVDRHTVQRRLRKVEETIGEPLSGRRAELDVALRLERLTAAQVMADAP